MTLSQLRNRVRALQRKYARELAIYHLRKLAREISDECAVAVADGEELPHNPCRSSGGWPIPESSSILT